MLRNVTNFVNCQVSEMSETISATPSKVIIVPNVFGKIVEHPRSLALKGTRDTWNDQATGKR